jgi:hypothetical protein
MPEIGEQRTGKELGKKRTGLYLYIACPNCGMGHWVRKRRPGKGLCRICGGKEGGKANKGIRRSPTTEFKKGHPQGKGKDNPAWKGGKTIDANGYVLVKVPDHPFANHQGYIFEHRLIMEKMIGRHLDLEEVIHHINNIPDDNREENLRLFSNNSEHISFHEKGKKNDMPKL